jgi:hypothetical protein
VDVKSAVVVTIDIRVPLNLSPHLRASKAMEVWHKAAAATANGV